MRFTFQQALNGARRKNPRLFELVLDDEQVVQDINTVTHELVDAVTKSDHTLFAQKILYSVDIDAVNPLTSVTVVTLPDWISQLKAVQAVYSSGEKRRMRIKRLEQFVRDELSETWEDLIEDTGERAPLMYLRWNQGEWELEKHDNATMWVSVTDMALVVDGVKTPATTATLTTNVPLPGQALRSVEEGLAIQLMRRAGLAEQLVIAQEMRFDREKERFVMWAGDYNLTEDHPFDPDIV